MWYRLLSWHIQHAREWGTISPTMGEEGANPLLFFLLLFFYTLLADFFFSSKNWKRAQPFPQRFFILKFASPHSRAARKGNITFSNNQNHRNKVME